MTDLQGENVVILTARPRGHGALCGLREILCQAAMESEFAVESCVRGTTSTKSLGEELPCEWYAVAVMRRRTIVGYRQEDVSCSLAISGRSAACLLFLADQLLARYFQRQQRYCSIMSACARLRASL